MKCLHFGHNAHSKMPSKGNAMSENYVLKAEARDRAGKGSARALRRQGLIPAVIYGDSKEPVTIALPRKEITLKIHSGGFLTTLCDIEVDGTKHHVLPKDYQLDPVKDVVMHVDFLRVSAKTKVTVNIPVHFLNDEDCPGIKEQGGVLNVVRYEIEVNCPANSIPEFFSIDLKDAHLGDSIHASTLDLPKGVELTITDRDFTIATIATPAGLRSQTDEEEDETAADEVPAIAQDDDAGEAESGDSEE